MILLNWNRYSLATRILGAANGILLILGLAFGDELLTEVGVPERRHLIVLGLVLLLPTLWLLARIKVEDEHRGESGDD